MRLSTSEMARAVEANINAQLRLLFAYMPGVEVYDEPDLLCMMSGLPGGAYNAVYWTAFSPAHVQARVDAVIERYRARGCLPVTWVVAPSSRPPGLSNALEARGFQVAFRGRGMAADLSHLVTGDAPPGLAIERVRNEVHLEQWLRPVADSFAFHPAATAACFDLFASLGFGSGVPGQLFVGLEGGQPVAASRLFYAEGVAGLYHVATLPRARGCGFGTAMTLAAAHAARELGYRTCVLTASPDGYGLYQRLGFQECVQANVYAGPRDAFR